MARRNTNVHTVFVGNLSYDANEEALRSIFERVGPVLALRLAYKEVVAHQVRRLVFTGKNSLALRQFNLEDFRCGDVDMQSYTTKKIVLCVCKPHKLICEQNSIKRDSENGRSRGIAFVEYADAGMAQSAVRNLNGMDVGGRNLRLDYTPPTGAAAVLDPKWPNAQEGANGAAAGAGSEVLGGMSVKELYEILSEMRKLVQQNPEQARTILVKQPAMTRALFHAQLKLGMLQGSAGPPPPGGPAQGPPQVSGAPRQVAMQMTMNAGPGAHADPYGPRPTPPQGGGGGPASGAPPGFGGPSPVAKGGAPVGGPPPGFGMSAHGPPLPAMPHPSQNQQGGYGGPNLPMVGGMGPRGQHVQPQHHAPMHAPHPPHLMNTGSAPPGFGPPGGAQADPSRLPRGIDARSGSAPPGFSNAGFPPGMPAHGLGQDNMDPSQQQALLAQVLSMTTEQMDRLTSVQRAQVEQLRALAQSQLH